jgi:chromate transporter
VAAMMTHDLLALTTVFGKAGLIAVGGVITVLPEIQHEVVDVHHWMDARTFAGLFALAQASPGPNMLVVTLVGWRVSGIAGAIVASAALMAPPAVLAYAMSSIWRRFRGARSLAVVQAGLTCVTVGLIAAAAALLVENSVSSVGSGVLLAVASVVTIATRLNPMWLLAAGAMLGGAGIL